MEQVMEELRILKCKRDELVSRWRETSKRCKALEKLIKKAKENELIYGIYNLEGILCQISPTLESAKLAAAHRTVNIGCEYEVRPVDWKEDVYSIVRHQMYLYL